MRKSLTREERIRSKSDFKNIFQTSRSVSCRGAKLFYLKNDLGYCRFGITLKRKYGNSVERNRAKRLLKEIFRSRKDIYNNSYDILVLLYPGEDSYHTRLEQYLLLLKRAEIAEIIE